MSVWLNYLAERMRLYRNLGIFRVDEAGLWIDEPLDKALDGFAKGEPAPLPPDVPANLLAELGGSGEASLAQETPENDAHRNQD